MPSPTYREFLPSARLARYVECFWIRQNDGQSSSVQSVLPDGCADILFTCQKGQPVNLTLVGLMTTPLCVEQAAPLSYFGVRFHPGMAAAFVPEAAELTDRIEPLDSIWGSCARELLNQLAESSTSAQKIAVLEQSLRPLEPPDPVRRVLWQLPSSNDLAMAELISQAGLSERHFRRACLAQTGVSPKYLQRILRFRRSVERIRSISAQPAQPSWAQLATACGYFDQAHFIRDFQEFSGHTPGRFLQSLRLANALELKNDVTTKT